MREGYNEASILFEHEACLLLREGLDNFYHLQVTDYSELSSIGDAGAISGAEYVVP